MMEKDRNKFINELYTKAEVNAKVICSPIQEKAFIKCIKILGFKNKRAFIMKLFKTVPASYLEPNTFHKANMTLLHGKASNMFPDIKGMKKRATKAKLTLEDWNGYQEYHANYSKICISVISEMKYDYIKKGDKVETEAKPYLKAVERLNSQSQYLKGKPVFSNETMKFIRENIINSENATTKSLPHNKPYLTWNRTQSSCSNFSKILYSEGLFYK